MRVITIGRSPENDVVVNDPKVSRIHLQLVLNDNGAISAVDLNTVNGSYINGQRITGEVRLQPNDVIRIGDTILPWQTYLKQSSRTGAATGKRSRTILYIAVCAAAAVLILGGIGAGYYYYSIRQQRIEAEKTEKEKEAERLRQEAREKEAEAVRLQQEADELFTEALISQNADNRKLAEAKQKEADAAKKQAELANEAMNKAEAARREAELAKQEAIKAKETAEHNSKIAIQEAKNQAEQKVSAANEERDFANTKAELTTAFYDELLDMPAKLAKQICEYLKLELPKDKTDAKAVLKDSFNAADNNRKQEIIDAIRAVKQQESTTEVDDE